jgi:hypothetical protein
MHNFAIFFKIKILSESEVGFLLFGRMKKRLPFWTASFYSHSLVSR